MLTSPATYWSIGGADEDFVGHYGYTDVHLVHRASLAHVPTEVISYM